MLKELKSILSNRTNKQISQKKNKLTKNLLLQKKKKKLTLKSNTHRLSFKPYLYGIPTSHPTNPQVFFFDNSGAVQLKAKEIYLFIFFFSILLIIIAHFFLENHFTLFTTN